jgi:hypothetical protein
MRSNGFLSVLVGFLTCTVLLLVAAMVWSIKEQRKQESDILALENTFMKAEAEWAEVRQVALSQLQLEQKAAEARASQGETFEKLTKETREAVVTVSQNLLLYKLDLKDRHTRHDQNMESLSNSLKTNGITWNYVGRLAKESAGSN